MIFHGGPLSATTVACAFCLTTPSSFLELSVRRHTLLVGLNLRMSCFIHYFQIFVTHFRRFYSIHRVTHLGTISGTFRARVSGSLQGIVVIHLSRHREAEFAFVHEIFRGIEKITLSLSSSSVSLLHRLPRCRQAKDSLRWSPS